VYNFPFSHLSTANELSSINSSCIQGSIICVGASLNGSNTMLLLSCGECQSIINFTQLNSPVFINSAYWYLTQDYSFGFSPSSTILQEKCDIYDIQNNLRMCWLMNKLSKRDLNVITGGSRIGTEINLDSDSTHVKQIYLKSPKALATGGITASTSSITITNKQNTTTSNSISSVNTQITVPSTSRVSTNSNPSLIIQTSSPSGTTLNQIISTSVTQINSASSLNTFNVLTTSMNQIISTSVSKPSTNSVSQTSTFISFQASIMNTNTQITNSYGYQTDKTSSTTTSLTTSSSNWVSLVLSSPQTSSISISTIKTLTTISLNNSFYSTSVQSVTSINTLNSNQLLNLMTNISNNTYSTMYSNYTDHASIFLSTNTSLLNNTNSNNQTTSFIFNFTSNSTPSILASSTSFNFVNISMSFNSSSNISMISAYNTSTLAYHVANQTSFLIDSSGNLKFFRFN